ncbi:hypothetical protein E8L99_23510 [Phreatobacter aquaticus]|uniref:Uncharacterized protein n=1 Tax=Phreatobacter aquaticus TaxID=2570229 RepID=A0A4D7QTG9_9HYPH|nr:hypothetical protein [Phreatobacter aquaticus]QCK88514.1 hypothetical protein E8L99_23510 [Phreatobacter aquaticus]
MTFGLVAPAAAVLAPRSGQPVAVIAWSADRGGAATIAARAQGDLIAPGRTHRIVVARSTEPDFVTRLYGEGALLVLDAATLTACLSPLFSFAAELRR